MRSERPTITPPFDPAAYARESESKMRSRAPIPAKDEESGIQPIATRLELDDPDDGFGAPTRPVPIVLIAVPTLAVSRAELSRLAIDHRAGFVLSHVDGVSSVETILDVSAMPHEETLRILTELAARGIVVIR